MSFLESFLNGIPDEGVDFLSMLKNHANEKSIPLPTDDDEIIDFLQSRLSLGVGTKL